MLNSTLSYFVTFQTKFRQLLLAIGAITALTVTPISVLNTQAATLEEVVVTARKRAESLQDVPVAVQAVSGDFIAEKGLVDIQALAPYTPNFSYATAVGANDLLLMRGVGSIGSGPTFEPAVGQVFNGLFISRSRLGRNAMVDLAQIEVLKGPQGAIIGKNTSLGALNITSKKPTEEFEVKLAGGYNWEDSEGYEATGVISGPLSDAVRGRLVIDTKDTDGWFDNTFTNTKVPTNESLSGRVTLVADLSDTLTGELLYQNTDVTRTGKTRDAIFCDPSNRDLLISQGILCGQNESRAGKPVFFGETLEDDLTIETQVASVKLDWEFDSFVLTSQTGYADYEIVDLFGNSLTNAEEGIGDPGYIRNDEEYDQWTQEFRVVSTGGETLDYILGAFYMDNELDFAQVMSPLGPRFRTQLAGVTTESLGLFGQVDYHLSESWDITAGLRWTSEEREGFIQHFRQMIAGGLDGPVVCAQPAHCTNGDGSTLSDSIDESNVSGNLSLAYKNDNGMFYAAYANGVKSGAFDLVGRVNPDPFVIDEEEADNFEIGGKHEFDGSLRFNWVLFYMDIEGLQMSAVDPRFTDAAVQIVGGADVTSQGLEVDLTWAATDALTLTFSGAYTDVEIDDFIGACWQGQSEAEGCLNGRQDLAGKRLPFAPELSVVFGADYVWQLEGGMELSAGTRIIYSDDYLLQVDQHPEAVQDAETKIDLSLTLKGDHGDNRWSLALSGRNVGDKTTYQFANTGPLFNVDFGGGPRPMNSFPEEGRVISLKAAYTWQ